MIAGEQPTLRPGGHFLEEATFDLIVFGSGEKEQRFSFAEFRDLPLRRRVHLLLSSSPRFFLNGEEISRAQAMRFQT